MNKIYRLTVNLAKCDTDTVTRLLNIGYDLTKRKITKRNKL